MGADASTIMPWNTVGNASVGSNTSTMNAYGFPVSETANNNEFAFLTYVYRNPRKNDKFNRIISKENSLKTLTALHYSTRKARIRHLARPQPPLHSLLPYSTSTFRRHPRRLQNPLGPSRLQWYWTRLQLLLRQTNPQLTT